MRKAYIRRLKFLFPEFCDASWRRAFSAVKPGGKTVFLVPALEKSGILCNFALQTITYRIKK
jgi:hypothetical protein